MQINPSELRIRAAYYRQVASTGTNSPRDQRRLICLASGLERQADVLERLVKHADMENDLV